MYCIRIASKYVGYTHHFSMYTTRGRGTRNENNSNNGSINTTEQQSIMTIITDMMSGVWCTEIKRAGI